MSLFEVIHVLFLNFSAVRWWQIPGNGECSQEGKMNSFVPSLMGPSRLGRRGRVDRIQKVINFRVEFKN
jgi:hypothetical protein